MVKCLITRPNHDKVTSYLFYWSKEILDFPYKREIQFLDLKDEKVNRKNVESYLKKQNPRLVLFNGHGSDKCIFGFKDEPLVVLGENEELLQKRISYALSCSSAKELGKKAVETKEGSFIGYKDSFMLYTNSDSEATPLKDEIAASFLRPSNKLSISLIRGNSAQQASDKSKEDFKKEIRNFLTSKSIEGGERIAMALFWNLNNQVVLGDKEACV